MKNLFTSKPHLFFLAISAFSLVIALAYHVKSPESYVDLAGDISFSVKNTYIWFIFSIYLLVLSGIYFTAAKGKLKTKRWLVTLHFTFILLFLFVFMLFSSFSSAFIQDHLSGLSFFALMGIYGSLFLIDLVSFAIGLVLLLANVISFKRTQN